MPSRRPLPRRKRKPAPADAMEVLTTLSQQQGPEAVVARCQTWIQSRQMPAAAWKLLGAAHLQLNQVDQAAESLETANRLEPDDTAARWMLAHVLQQLGRRSEALSHLRRVVQDCPERMDVWCRLIEAEIRDDDLPSAREHHDRARTRLSSETDPTQQADLMFLSGWLLLKEGDPEQAVAEFKRCLESDPTEVEARQKMITALRELGDEAAVHAALEDWHQQDPANPVVEHLLAAYQHDSDQKRASVGYVQNVFDKFADHFEEQLLGLGYQGPAQIAERLDQWDLPPDLVVLDAGCGTGLMAPELRTRASSLIGVDLSEKMLDQARLRQQYDSLVQADLVSYLCAHSGTFDLIVSADTFNYFGDLNDLLGDTYRALRDTGRLIFSLESDAGAQSSGGESGCSTPGYRLNTSGRYSHLRNYVQETLESHGFTSIRCSDAPLRQESDVQVIGQYWQAVR